MNNLNSIILEGNIVRDPECTTPSDGFRVCKFCIAVNRFNKNSKGEAVEEVSYIDVEAYGKMVDSCEKNVFKGRGIRVVGRIKQSRWKDSEGKSKSKLFVVAEHLEYKPKQNRNDSFSESEKSGVEGDAEASGEKHVESVKETVMF